MLSIVLGVRARPCRAAVVVPIRSRYGDDRHLCAFPMRRLGKDLTVRGHRFVEITEHPR